MTKKNIRKILFNIISILNVLVPKNKKKIFFYDSTFRKDNLWALCKHMSENNYDDNYEYKKLNYSCFFSHTFLFIMTVIII